MKYIYNIAIVFLLLLIIWNLYFSNEYFSQKEKKVLKTYQKFIDVYKPYITKSGSLKKNISVKEEQKLRNKLNSAQKELMKYENAFSPTQEKRMSKELKRRNPWAKKLIFD
jgi:hypothetical protein